MEKNQPLRDVALNFGDRISSVTEYATDVIRHGILSGRLSPGSALRQEDLAIQLSISRVPVREALRVLQKEGLANFQPRCGFTVTHFDMGDLLELAEMRYSFEVLALSKAIPHHTAATLSALDECLFSLNIAEKAKQPDERQKLHRQFHMSLYSPCGMKRLMSSIETTFDLYDCFSRIGASQLPIIQQYDIHEHGLLLGFMKDQNIEQASALLRKHIVDQAQMLIEELQKLSTCQEKVAQC
ncbi:MAG: GntR family transcriptional regulator [Pseudomonadota bacterium]